MKNENNIYKKKEKVELTNKVDFFNYHKPLFRIISLVLGNVFFECQLKDLLLTTGYFETEREFIEFLNASKCYGLLKTQDDKDKIGTHDIYIAKDYVVQNVTKSNKSQYKYSINDAKTSYYKMYYILDLVKSRANHNHSIDELEKILVNYTTLGIGKTQYLKLYKKLKNKNMLNVNGELMLEDLQAYEDYKLLNLRMKSKNKRVLEAVESLLNDETFMYKLNSTYDRISGNQNFWDYNLGKICDNKSYFMFFNTANSFGYKLQAPGTIDLVKFDTVGNFGNAELGDYVTKVMESIKHNVKEEYRNINMYIYFPDEDVKDRVFGNCVNHKIGRHGIKNLDSNLTARIKETSRRIYQCKLISFDFPRIDFNNYTVSYKIYYSSKNQNPDDFYTLTIYFKNANFENDIYSKEDLEKKQIELEKKRNERKIDEIINDSDLLALMLERLKERKS